jgi:SNF2 family DNA or RNA helicase
MKYPPKPHKAPFPFKQMHEKSTRKHPSYSERAPGSPPSEEFISTVLANLSIHSSQMKEKVEDTSDIPPTKDSSIDSNSKKVGKKVPESGLPSDDDTVNSPETSNGFERKDSVDGLVDPVSGQGPSNITQRPVEEEEKKLPSMSKNVKEKSVGKEVIEKMDQSRFSELDSTCDGTPKEGLNPVSNNALEKLKAREAQIKSILSDMPKIKKAAEAPEKMCADKSKKQADGKASDATDVLISQFRSFSVSKESQDRTYATTGKSAHGNVIATPVVEPNRTRFILDDSTTMPSTLTYYDINPRESRNLYESPKKFYSFDDFRNYLDNSCSEAEIDLIDPPPKLKLEPFAHQRTGFSWLVYKEEKMALVGLGRGGILADEMGLGKTFQMAMLFAHRRPTEGFCGTLVILPVSLMNQWASEIPKYFQFDFTIARYHGPNRHALNVTEYDLVLTSYDTLASDEKNGGPLADSPWYRIVLDEAHLIQNEQTNRTKAILKLSAQYKWCITGTPVQNRVTDLFALVKFLEVPGVTNSSKPH